MVNAIFSPHRTVTVMGMGIVVVKEPFGSGTIVTGAPVTLVEMSTDEAAEF
jgi:hypothetical protein